MTNASLPPNSPSPPSAAAHPRPSGAATPAEQAAREFLDFWLVWGGQNPRHSGSRGMLGLSWREMSEQALNSRGPLSYQLNPLMALATSESLAARTLASSVKWCFLEDAEHLSRSDSWHFGDSVHFLATPAALGLAPRQTAMGFYSLAHLPSPVPALTHALALWRKSSFGSVFSFKHQAPDAQSAMIALFDCLSAQGFVFDHALQEAVWRDGVAWRESFEECDVGEPLHEKVDRVIPALAAAAEARALKQALHSSASGGQSTERPSALWSAVCEAPAAPAKAAAADQLQSHQSAESAKPLRL